VAGIHLLEGDDGQESAGSFGRAIDSLDAGILISTSCCHSVAPYEMAMVIWVSVTALPTVVAIKMGLFLR